MEQQRWLWQHVGKPEQNASKVWLHRYIVQEDLLQQMITLRAAIEESQQPVLPSYALDDEENSDEDVLQEAANLLALLPAQSKEGYENYWGYYADAQHHVQEAFGKLVVQPNDAKALINVAVESESRVRFFRNEVRFWCRWKLQEALYAVGKDNLGKARPAAVDDGRQELALDALLPDVDRQKVLFWKKQNVLAETIRSYCEEGDGSGDIPKWHTTQQVLQQWGQSAGKEKSIRAASKNNS